MKTKKKVKAADKATHNDSSANTNAEEAKNLGTASVGVPTLLGKPVFEYSVNEYLVLSGECTLEEVNPKIKLN